MPWVQGAEVIDTYAPGSIMVGVDPGVSTGLALWDRLRQKLVSVDTVMIHEAWQAVLSLHLAGALHSVTFEDARLRTGYFGKNAKAKQQGAGSVKRDCKAWADFLGAHGIAYRAVSPQAKGAKVDAATFAKLSGYQGKTNEHGRDAGMLVIGAKEMVPA
jgi:hypothetical protein